MFSDGKFVRIQMGLLAYIADRPERHAILNQTQAGIFGKRTLWSAFIDSKHLPYCDRCFNSEIESLLDDNIAPFQLPSCGRCCQWNMLSTSPSNKKVKASEIDRVSDYPTTFHTNSPPVPREREIPSNYLKPVKCDFEWFLCVMRYAAHNVLYGGWKKRERDVIHALALFQIRLLIECTITFTTWILQKILMVKQFNRMSTYRKYGYQLWR